MKCVHGSNFAVLPASLNGVKVGVDARISIDGTAYEVDPAMAGETVILLWGLFDSELYIEFEGDRSVIINIRPIPLHRYRAFKRGKTDERADRIRAFSRSNRLTHSGIVR